MEEKNFSAPSRIKFSLIQINFFKLKEYYLNQRKIFVGYQKNKSFSDSEEISRIKEK